MAGLENCPKCGNLFVKNNLRDVCENCYKEEEKKYELVSKFLRKRENRAAMITTIVEATQVEEELIYKWVKKGRLHTTHFPNLGYPCSKCGTLIKEGKLCKSCTSEIKKDLSHFDETEKLKVENTRHQTYLSK
ncbi:hypothetical protein AN964_05285 [Heyndrickxia shackletonii]|uniref:Flagellar operon protein (TIGR03826 family) n=1 Tax=Heyndrickxia shackletonii TaxID=157838 RepID=A0A0Q3WU08_9BACI|nr:TIGR03826 family flagellar region protein [Heyndrickxia shackletonii]KQL52980.1 hypothetical protein AN964_05285 [Heyndrickxia shackletonii]MBB2481651.1 hypothetical protein [Bacillus sp. APMAM]NEY98528.1 hypothetical protein [Heyndrickxia shackletonii]RTZ55037.1 hypothetical protein EKO25_15075 [Bacillus sp. SAJ1]